MPVFRDESFFTPSLRQIVLQPCSASKATQMLRQPRQTVHCVLVCPFCQLASGILQNHKPLGLSFGKSLLQPRETRLVVLDGLLQLSLARFVDGLFQQERIGSHSK